MKCPLCSSTIEAVFSRNVGLARWRKSLQDHPRYYRALHGRHPHTCVLRFEDLGFGETPEACLKDAEEKLYETKLH